MIAVSNKENSSLLTELLMNQYYIVPFEKENKINRQVDLIIVDAVTLSLWRRERLHEYLFDREASSDPLQPILLITPKESLHLISNPLWQSVDEVITTPISKMELFARTEMLLRARRQSVQLHDRNTSLTLENDDLQREARSLTDFFTNVSHDLKAPLSVILSGIDFLSMCYNANVMQSDKCLQTLEVSRKHSLKLLRMINHLLDLSKIESGCMKLNLRNIDIAAALQEIVDSVKDYGERKSITLSFKVQTQCRGIAVDPELLERIMLNLLSNAIKHTPPQGEISVILRDSPDGENIVIDVKDNGVGIPTDKQRVIFDRFVQADNMLNKQPEGCGLGLSLVKSLVEMHDGRIWLISKPGMGSQFSFTLPLRRVAEDQPWDMSPVKDAVYDELADFL